MQAHCQPQPVTSPLGASSIFVDPRSVVGQIFDATAIVHTCFQSRALPALTPRQNTTLAPNTHMYAAPMIPPTTHLHRHKLPHNTHADAGGHKLPENAHTHMPTQAARTHTHPSMPTQAARKHTHTQMSTKAFFPPSQTHGYDITPCELVQIKLMNVAHTHMHVAQDALAQSL